jgi:uncharacterized membrane protein
LIVSKDSPPSLLGKTLSSSVGTAQTPKSLLFFALTVCLFIALRLWNLTTYGLWFDEAFSHKAAQLGWSELLSYVLADIVHPPLFYLLLKLWIGVGGESLLWLKLLPVLTSVVTLVPFSLLCTELKLTAAETNIALFLVAVNAFLIQYAQELRMYSLVVFLTLWSLWLFVKLVKAEGRQKRILVGLFAVNLLLAYTHYFGWLVVGTEALYLLLRKRRYFWLFAISVAGLVLCYAPWAYLVFQAVVAKGGRRNAGLEPGNLSDVIWHFATLHGTFDIRRTTLLGLILFGLPLLWLTWRVLKRKQQASLALPVLFSFSFMPVIFTFLFSSFVQPIWTDRYLIISAIPYIILIAVAVHGLRPTWVRTLILVLIATWAGLSCLHRLDRGNYRFDWFALVRQMEQAETAKTERVRVYCVEGYVGIPIESALKFLGDTRFEVVQVADLNAMRGGYFWMAFRDTTWDMDRLPQTFLREMNCQVGQEISVSTHIDQRLSVGEAVSVFPVVCPE